MLNELYLNVLILTLNLQTNAISTIIANVTVTLIKRLHPTREPLAWGNCLCPLPLQNPTQHFSNVK